MNIRCPKCRWKPGPLDLWGCSCGHAWNTFDTRGRCPACGKVWKMTQCLACSIWSPHNDWYGGDDGAETKGRSKKKRQPAKV